VPHPCVSLRRHAAAAGIRLAFCCLACTLLLWAGAAAASQQPENTFAYLYEIVTSDADAEIGSLCRNLERSASGNALVLLQPEQVFSRLSSFKPEPVPCIFVNRSFYVHGEDSHDVPQRMASALADGHGAAQWKVSLYLSATAAPGGRQEVNIAVCNLETTRTFNGRYAVWLVSKGPDKNENCWKVVDEVAAGEIAELPQDETRGCPMPEHFSLPPDQGAGGFALVAVVFDRMGEVQAVAAELLDKGGPP